MNKSAVNIIATKLVLSMLFVFLVMVPTLSRAGQKTGIDQDSSLEDLLAAAALNNAGLKAAFEQWQAALRRVPQARALPDPQVTFAYFIREIETRVGPQQAKVGLMQMFPWFGKLKLKGSAALQAAEAARQQYEAAKLNLFYTVKEAYYDYYFALRRVEILQENVQLLEHLENVIEVKYRTGAASYGNLIRLQVERDKLNVRLRGAVDVLEPIKASLNAALNRPLDAPLPTVKEISVPTESLPLSIDHLASLVKKNNPRLKAMASMTEKEQVGIKLARKNYFPDFSIGVDYMLTGEARMSGVSDSGKDPVAAMVSVRLPLWAKKDAVKEAAAKHRAAGNQRQEMENRLLARLEMVLFNLRDAQRKLELYRDLLLPRAQQALEVSRSAFEAGKADFMEFVDSQRMLLAFQLEYQEAMTHYAQRLAELDLLVGGPFGESLFEKSSAKTFSSPSGRDGY